MHRPHRDVAKSPTVTGRVCRGQVLAFFALVLSIVLLPVAAYAVDATIVAGREADLQAATAQAAETAAERLNVSSLRATSALTLDPAAAGAAVAETLLDEEPGARVDAYSVIGTEVSVLTSEPVALPFSVFTHTVTLHAHATARLAAGFDGPSPPTKQPPTS